MIGKINTSRPRPFQVEESEYPFRDRWFTRDGVSLHFIDEGAGVPVLMLHGNPTWSFLYRNIIQGAVSQCRCIAPDYPGFGLSDHPPGYGYTPQEHAEWIDALVDHLDLEGMILLVQDWGGPIGLSVGVNRPEAVLGLVICNTWCWAPTLDAALFSCFMGGPIGKLLHLRFNLFARVLVPLGIAQHRAKRPEVLQAYTAPFPTPRSRMGTYVFPGQIRRASAWLETIKSRLSCLKDKPVELVWGMRDPAFGREYYIERWRDYFPHAQVDRIPHASHYLQEDDPQRIATAVGRVLERVS